MRTHRLFIIEEAIWTKESVWHDVVWRYLCNKYLYFQILTRSAKWSAYDYRTVGLFVSVD